MFFRSKGSFSSVDSGLTRVLSPIGIVVSNSTSGIGSFLSNLSNIGKLQKENKQCEDRVNALETQVAAMKEQVKENEALKKELGFKQGSNFQTLAAEISFFDPTNIRETITINKGKADGVKTEMVVTNEGFLVGKVSEVHEKTSKIVLITDPLSSIPASFSNSSLSGLVQGQVGLGLVMTQIPIESEVKQGDAVVTSGIGGQYPKGLLIGKVESITKKNNSIFQTASLRSFINFAKLERVQIILSQ